jgi:hypothetical protein
VLLRFHEEKRSFEDWHKLYITAAPTSDTLKNRPKGRQGREFAGHMTGVIRKVNSKKPKDHRDSWGRCPRQLD